MSDSRVYSNGGGLRPDLALAALGVVFGDIGTSPLYALRACLTAGGSSNVSSAAVLGVLSLIFWALALTITAKYLLIILRNDNDGEGGVLALTALASTETSSRYRALIPLLGLAGCALFYGDGVITPAVTVLSAVEGLAIVAPAFAAAVVPLAILVLFALFKMQRRGTGALGGMFGWVMLLWFLTLGALGLHGIIKQPAVLAAVNPLYAIDFLLAHSGIALLVVGSVFLAVTGGEALYADLGHFGVKPIRMAWFFVAWPALVLNYFGQGAQLLVEPAAIANPFFHLAPDWFLAPLVLLATAAAIIASQAVISGVFSMTQQALQLGFLPSVRIIQSSAEAMGQIYVPSVNWLLCLASIGLVIGFGSSESLANAYGIAVASTMVIETSLLLALLHSRSGWSSRALLYCLLPLAVVDVLFFVANADKIPQGGWLPLLAALVMFYIMRTWTRGRVRVSELMRREGRSDAKFLAGIEADPPARVPGLAVFLTSDAASVPRTLIRNVRHNGVLHKHTVLLTLKIESVPKIVRGGRATVTEIGHGIYRIVASMGFMDLPDVPRLLREAERRGLPFRTDDATFFLGREDIVIGARRELATWRKQLFMFMARNAQFAGERFGIAPSRIIEIGGQVEL